MPLLILAGIIPFILKTDWPLFLEVIINLMTLFVVAVACHGELAKRRPATSPPHALLSLDRTGRSAGRTIQRGDRAANFQHRDGISAGVDFRGAFAANDAARRKTSAVQLARCGAAGGGRRAGDRRRSAVVQIRRRAGSSVSLDRFRPAAVALPQLQQTPHSFCAGVSLRS